MQQDRSQCRAELDSRGRCTLTLARPEVHNALSQTLVAELDELLTWAASRSETRLLVLRSEGRHFCAGADLKDMQAMAAADREENLADARKLAGMLRRLDTFPRPVLALVQGATYGGAVGVVCCCDTVIASSRARFCLSEARLGLAASVISPYVVRVLGPRQARHFTLTAEVLDAAAAHRAGLVQTVTDDLETAGSGWEQAVLAGAPGAQAEIKSLIRQVAGHPVDDALVEMTAGLIADLRASEEGREGLAAFFAKRPPRWAPDKE